jgi:hypothetical protein
MHAGPRRAIIWHDRAGQRRTVNEPSPIGCVQIVRERVAPVSRAAWEALEDEIARACAELGCPHPHAALVPAAPAPEVWWLNLFASDAHRRQVIAAFAANQPLMTALTGLGQRKRALATTTLDVVVTAKPEVSDGMPWTLRGARAVIFCGAAEDQLVAGAAFEDADQRRYYFASFASRHQAEAARTARPSTAQILTIAPRWGLPAEEWIEAEPALWAANPRRAIRP